jgi:hypothetical protein
MTTGSTKPRRRVGLAAIAVSVALVAGATGPAAASAPPPSLRLLVAQSHVRLQRFGHAPVELDLGAYIASGSGTFRIDVTRPGYGSPIEAAQIVSSGGGTIAIPLPDGLVKGWSGLPWFLRISVDDAHGHLVATRHVTFCPDGWDQQRVSSNGPIVPSFPQSCGVSPFTLGMVWGIDDGWAVNPVTSAAKAPMARLPNGTYTVHLAINPTYAHLFAIASQDAEATVTATVRGGRNVCGPICPLHRHTAVAPDGPHRDTVTTSSPDPATEPDLVALPAWSIRIHEQAKRDFLDFSATVWDGGPASMVVEGFRRPGTNLMDAWEYFIDRNGDVVGRAKVGTLKYDARPGHEHWHFQQFARYQLLDRDKVGVVDSGKEGFCLAPTDPIDLAVPGAVWNPGPLGFGGTVCGSQTSIWTREVLPAGWGDSYSQSLPGQSFDITNVPNGTYYVAVEANPLGALYETNSANDVQYRRVILGGTRGHRTVRVPPWHGIKI